MSYALQIDSCTWTGRNRKCVICGQLTHYMAIAGYQDPKDDDGILNVARLPIHRYHLTKQDTY